MQRGSVTLWNALQCDVVNAEQAGDNAIPCTFAMKTAIIYIPDSGEEAVCNLIASGWAPKKATRWTTAWSVKDGVFQPSGGLWLLSAKVLQIPCEIA